MSEHHNSASIVGTAPEILMAAIAAMMTREYWRISFEKGLRNPLVSPVRAAAYPYNAAAAYVHLES